MSNNLNRSGVYCIGNLINKKMYIGSAINLHRRLISHRSMLNGNRHINVHFQAAWNKYGEANFIFGIVEFVDDKSILLEREQYWIDKSQCYKLGYNRSPTAGSNFGKIFGSPSKEHRIKISKALKGKQKPEWFSIRQTERQLGIKLSNEHRLNISLSRIGNQFRRLESKWPCKEGCKCKCNDCMQKKRDRNNNYYNSKYKYEDKHV